MSNYDLKFGSERSKQLVDEDYGVYLRKSIDGNVVEKF
jgi:hypothetical protein